MPKIVIEYAIGDERDGFRRSTTIYVNGVKLQGMQRISFSAGIGDVFPIVEWQTVNPDNERMLSQFSSPVAYIAQSHTRALELIDTRPTVWEHLLMDDED